MPAEALAGDGARLTVLDGCDPVQLADALDGDLASTVLVVSAPPGADTAAAVPAWDALDAAFRAEGLDPAAHTVLVAPPGSALVARAGGAPVVPGPATLPVPGDDLADQASTAQTPQRPCSAGNPCEVGAWAALTPYALVPAGLAGADVGALLGGALAEAGEHDLVDRLRDTSGHVALTGPAAESLAQILAVPGHARPLVVERPGAPGWESAALTVGDLAADVPADGPVASELLRWQRAVASLPGSPGPPSAGVPVAWADPVLDGDVEIRAPWPVTTLRVALATLVDGAACVAVHAHLDRHDDASAALLRTELSARTGLVTAFGWAARTLPTAPAVLQITGAGPDGPPAVHQRCEADRQAAALAASGVRVLRVHLRDRLAGLVGLVRAVQELAT